MTGSEIADWIAAIGQAVGAIGTFAAVLVALSVAKRDGRKLEIDRQDRQASQARLILTRTEEDWGDISVGSRSCVLVRNNSDRTISTLSILKGEAPEKGLVWIASDAARVGVDVLDANGTARLDGSWGEPEPGTKLTGPTFGVNTTIRFVDSSGVWWDRLNNSEPVRAFGSEVAKNER